MHFFVSNWIILKWDKAQNRHKNQRTQQSTAQVQRKQQNIMGSCPNHETLASLDAATSRRNKLLRCRPASPRPHHAQPTVPPTISDRGFFPERASIDLNRSRSHRSNFEATAHRSLYNPSKSVINGLETSSDHRAQ